MKLIILMLIAPLIQTGITFAQVGPKDGQKLHNAAFGVILDSLDLQGTILIYDAQGESFHSNDYEQATRGSIPASTFKIPHSIIALEAGIVVDESHVFEWDGQKRALENWEQNLTLKQAFQFSCVPCYQGIARSIGVTNMRRYLESFDYGTMKFDSTQIDSFWLRGNSTISPFEQIDFLRRFYAGDLGISAQTMSVVKNIMMIENILGGRLRGKTGLSSSAETSIGWFVGYLEVAERVYFFATNVQPRSQNSTGFNEKRVIATKLALQTLQP
jgi:beta-lactamase class D